MADYISTVSRHLDPTSRSWVSVVYQTGKSILDSELNLAQSIQGLRQVKGLPSGVLSEYPTGAEGGLFSMLLQTLTSELTNSLLSLSTSISEVKRYTSQLLTIVGVQGSTTSILVRHLLQRVQLQTSRELILFSWRFGGLLLTPRRTLRVTSE